MSSGPPESPYPPGPPSGGQGYDAPGAAQAGTPGKAVASLVLGIVGIVICPLICSTLALIFGYQAKREIESRPGSPGGGLATAGIVLGWIGVVLGVLGVVLIVAGVVGS